MAAVNEYNLNRQRKKNFFIGDIVQKEDESLLTDHMTGKKYLQGKIKNMMSGHMELTPIDETGSAVKGRTIHIKESEVPSLKIVTPMNSRNYRRAREERAAENRRRGTLKQIDAMYHLFSFRKGLSVIYNITEYDYTMGQQSVIAVYKIPATIINIIEGPTPWAPASVEIRYNTADSKPAIPDRLLTKKGVITETVPLSDIEKIPSTGGRKTRHARRSKRSKRKTRSNL
jgi:hypothetical protein